MTVEEFAKNSLRPGRTICELRKGEVVQMDPACLRSCASSTPDQRLLAEAAGRSRCGFIQKHRFRPLPEYELRVPMLPTRHRALGIRFHPVGT